MPRRIPAGHFLFSGDLTSRCQVVHDGHMTTTRTDIDTIALDTLANGGATVSITGASAPVIGWLVALAGNEEVFPAGTFGANEVDAYITAHADHLRLPDHFLGTWVDDGKVYLDTSVSVIDTDAAIALGRANHQLAIFNIGTGDVLTLEAI